MLSLGILFLNGCNDKPEVQPSNSFDLQVYPNPVVDQATISVNTPKDTFFKLKVFSTTGELILDEEGTNGQQHYSLHLADKPKGKYQVILKTNKGIATKNLIKL